MHKKVAHDFMKFLTCTHPFIPLTRLFNRCFGFSRRALIVDVGSYIFQVLEMSRVFCDTLQWCGAYAKRSCRMAFKEKQILTCFLFIWLSFIKVRGFVVFNEGKGLDSAGSFNKNARTSQSFDRGNEKPKSGAQVGRLLIWQDQDSKSHGGGGVSLRSRSQPDENAYQSDDSGNDVPVIC